MKYEIGFLNGKKILKSEKYNYIFDMHNGNMFEWGVSKDDDPDWCPHGPTILDIEVTSICKGPDGIPCPFCYKANTANGHNMSIDTFKTVIDKIPPSLTQVAFGADAQAESNPDLFKMMEYCREKRLIPNITVADVSKTIAGKLVDVCGAIAVSAYKHASNFQTAYKTINNIIDAVFEKKLKMTREEFESFCEKHGHDPVQEFRQHGMQVNIHYFLSRETQDDAFTVMSDLLDKDDLKYVNALVFLHLKQKGRGSDYGIVSKPYYDNIVEFALGHKLNIGFDTCGAGKFKNYIDEYQPEGFEDMGSYIESCCAGRFSCYVNEYGDYYPCSFLEGVEGVWKSGISVEKCVDFMKDIWHSSKVKDFGCSALKCCNENTGCPYWTV